MDPAMDRSEFQSTPHPQVATTAHVKSFQLHRTEDARQDVAQDELFDERPGKQLKLKATSQGLEAARLPAPRGLASAAISVLNRALLCRWIAIRGYYSKVVLKSVRKWGKPRRGAFFAKHYGLIHALYDSKYERCQECGGPTEVFGVAIDCCRTTEAFLQHALYQPLIASGKGEALCPYGCGDQTFFSGLELAAHLLVLHGPKSFGLVGTGSLAKLIKGELGTALAERFMQHLLVQLAAAEALGKSPSPDLRAVLPASLVRG